MRVIEKLHDIWMRYGGGFDRLSRAEQLEIIQGAWTFALVCVELAFIGTIIMIIARLVSFFL